MRTTIIIIALLLISSFQLKADGPPVDSLGNIRGKYISIVLTQTQLDNLQKSRNLELTAEQQKKLASLNLPKIVDIVDPNWRDCTCGMVYGIWYKTTEVAFIVKDSSDNKSLSSDEFYLNYSKEYKKNELFIGIDGQLYYLGKLTTINELKKLLPQKLGGKDDKYLIVFIPPPKENKYWKKVLDVRSVINMSISPLVTKIYWM